MMNLDEAIQHCEEVAKEQESHGYCDRSLCVIMDVNNATCDECEAVKCRECASEHRQLAEWLKELKAYREQSGDAISRKYILDLIDTKGANLDDDLLIVEQWIQDAPSVNPHPIECGDAISRQAMHIELEKWITYGEYKYSNATKYLYDRIDRLPSVTPQQRTGRWIEHFDEIGKWYECDQCHTDWGGSVNYCPNCGAKMGVEE